MSLQFTQRLTSGQKSAQYYGLTFFFRLQQVSGDKRLAPPPLSHASICALQSRSCACRSNPKVSGRLCCSLLYASGQGADCPLVVQESQNNLQDKLNHEHMFLNEIKLTFFQTHILFITIKYFLLYYINPFKTIQIICAVINSSQMLSEFHAKKRNINPQQINHLIK